MDFRSRLIATLRAIEPVLAEPGVRVIGSEIPNLLEHGAASTRHTLMHKREIPLTLGPELMAERNLALLRIPLE